MELDHKVLDVIETAIEEALANSMLMSTHAQRAHAMRYHVYQKLAEHNLLNLNVS